MQPTRYQPDPIVTTPEDAVRHYDMAGLDGWVDDPAEGSLAGELVFVLGILIFAAVVFGIGMVVASIWNAAP